MCAPFAIHTRPLRSTASDTLPPSGIPASFPKTEILASLMRPRYAPSYATHRAPLASSASLDALTEGSGSPNTTGAAPDLGRPSAPAEDTQRNTATMAARRIMYEHRSLIDVTACL